MKISSEKFPSNKVHRLFAYLIICMTSSITLFGQDVLKGKVTGIVSIGDKEVASIILKDRPGCKYKSELLEKGTLSSGTEVEVVFSEKNTERIEIIFPELPDIVQARAICPDIFEPVYYASDPPANLNNSLSAQQITLRLNYAIVYASKHNKKLIVDPGTYKIDGPIYIPSGISIDFSGAIFIRETGPVFDMFVNGGPNSGNSGISLSNLTIDGNLKNGGNELVNRGQDRFSGLKFENVTDSRLTNITVTGTVNAENAEDREVTAGIINNFDQVNAAGIFIYKSSNIKCSQLNAHHNRGSGIYFYESDHIRLSQSLTHNNEGSGVTSGKAPYCEYYQLEAFYNGFELDNNNPNWRDGDVSDNFSGISVNGAYSKVDGILVHDCTGAGLNVGHDSNDNGSPNSIVKNVVSYYNKLGGIYIKNSSNTVVSNIDVYKNRDSNVKVRLSSGITIYNAEVHGYLTNKYWIIARGGNGIDIIGGDKHTLQNINSYNNWGDGIYIKGTSGFLKSSNTKTVIGTDVKCYDNGRSNDWGSSNDDFYNEKSAGIKLVETFWVELNQPEAYTTQTTGNITQKYGIYITKSGHITVNQPNLYQNGTSNQVKTWLNYPSSVYVYY